MGGTALKDKFRLTRAQNIALAKRNIAGYIYNSAKLEGCKVTFPETQTILAGVNVGSVTLNDIQKILNLRDAWRFVLSRCYGGFRSGLYLRGQRLCFAE